MKYIVKPSKKFKHDLKIAQKRGLDIEKLTKIILLLSEGKPLPPENKDHALTGNLAGKRECHIQPDWLLIYEYYEADVILYLVRTGTHSDLLNK